MTLQKVKVVKDPDWKPEWYAGGFAAHCANQSSQTWLYDGDADYTVKIRMTKNGWKKGSCRFDEGRANEFYDYNF